MNRFIICTLLACFLSSCGNSPSEESQQTKIAVIPKGTSHAFWKSVEAGARRAGEEFEVEILWDGPQKETEIGRQRSILESMVNRGVDGIAIAPLDERGMARPIENVIQRGIPVVIFDSDVEAEGYVSFVATDNERGGALGGERMVRQLGETTGQRLVMVKYSEGSGSTLRREKGFRDTVTEAGHEIVAEQFTDGTPEGALTVAANMLNGLIEEGVLQVDGIFASNESTAIGLLRALERLRKQGVNVSETVVVGFDSGPDLEAAVREGLFDSLVVQNPERMGYLAVKALVNTLKGADVEEVIDTGAELMTVEDLPPRMQDIGSE